MDNSVGRIGSTSTLPQVRHVEASRVAVWLRRGWDDLRSNPGASLGHGALLVALGWLILLACSTHVDLMAAAVSGFLLVGPVFAAAFYELSRLRAAGERASFDASLDGATARTRSLVPLGCVLAVLGVLWMLVSATLFERAFGIELPGLSEHTWRTVGDWDYAGFHLTYLATGALVALLAFVLSAVSAPLVYDQGASTRTAVLVSLKSIAVNPAAMGVWAFVIAALTALGFATFLLGLVVVLPLLGHATWHAYRDLVVGD